MAETAAKRTTEPPAWVPVLERSSGILPTSCASGAGDAGAPLSVRTHAPRVLLAEDEPSTRAILARVLRNLGMDVEEVPDGGRLLVRIAEQYRHGHSPAEIDLIVTDLHMPVCSGLDIVRAVCAARWPTAILLITAFPTEEAMEAHERLGVGLLVKPFDLEEFERTAVELVGDG